MAIRSLETPRSLATHLAVLFWLFAAPLDAADVAPATRELLSQFCTDCHGSPEEEPERGFAIGEYLGEKQLYEAGPLLKKALDAIEGYDMPPDGMDQPTTDQRRAMATGIRAWLAQTAQPGRPVLRQLTRLEYNNTVRDLLGLDTDVFMFPERLPFDKSYFRPETGSVPSRLTMRAREYGGKYPVLLANAGLPGDSRAEHGFSNRGDAQNTSAVRVEQYVELARQIMQSPDLLRRARRLQEIFPEANYQQPVVQGSNSRRLLVESVVALAPHDNISGRPEINPFTLAEFRQRLQRAFAEDRGGVYDGEPGKGSTVPGKGGVIQIAYGVNASRLIELNPSEDIWSVPFATANESSGDVLMANRVKGLKKFFFTIDTVMGKPGSSVVELGCIVLSRRGEQGEVQVTATFEDGTSSKATVDLAEGAGNDNRFVCFRAPDGQTIRRLAIDGSGFSGDYVLIDDLAFITRDPPTDKNALVGVEPPEHTDTPEDSAKADDPQLDLSVAKRPPRERLAHFMRRAFRRPVSDAEVALYFRLYKAAAARGAQPVDAMKATLAGVLASPNFLYVNLPVEGEFSDHVTPGDSASMRPITDHELASRLSYFLWSSMPDDELLELADNGRLRDPEVLASQTRRMLKDRRVSELSENFFVEWLRLRELWSASPDRRLYGSFYSGDKETLADDMFGEALLLFETVLVEDRSVLELIDTDYTYVNSALASRLYDFGDIQKLTLADSGKPIGALSENELKSAANWYRVRLPDQSRGGVMTTGATLTLTSFPTRTSPIKRGVWLLETVFNRSPSPPAFAVADIEEQEFSEELTIREKTKMHRAKAACAVCHNRIDPPGFALEGFDGIGRRRTTDGGKPIDDTGVILGAGSFDGPAEFKRQLLAQKERFVRGLAEKLLSYSTARELEYFDEPAVDRIVHEAANDDFHLSRVIIAIVQSDAFQKVGS